MLMSNPLEAPISEHDSDQYQRYRELSMAAVVALALGILSLFAFALPPLMILSIAGLLVGLSALRAIARRPSELTGRGLAKIGVSISSITLVSSIAITTFVYVTEVPDGYFRISYSDLQPEESRPDLPVPPSAIDLDGERIFVKGYIYPSDKTSNLKRFVMVPDMGTCCFGGQPALTDMIEVTLKDPLRTRYNRRRRRLAGTLHVDTRKKPVSGLDGVYYQLEADYIK
jgi:hypothetical protein